MTVLDRLPFEKRGKTVRHPVDAFQKALYFLRISSDMSRFLDVPRDTIRNWHHHLYDDVALPEELAKNWRKAHPDRPRTLGVGGSIGPYNEVLYLLIRSARPEKVVETGVAHGFSTSYLLQGLEDNGHGELHSIDLPNTDPHGFRSADGSLDRVYVEEPAHAGCVVSERLRHRWHLTLGPSNPNLPETLERLGPIDFFFHDSDHSAPNVTWELSTVWPHVKHGGLIAADDIQRTHAFDEFTAKVHAPWFRWFGPNGRDGVVRRTDRSGGYTAESQ